MLNRVTATALSVALAAALPVLAHASVPSQSAVVSASSDQVSLDSLLSSALGDTPSAQDISGLEGLLSSLATSNPAVAADLALSIARLAFNIAGTDPELSTRMIGMAINAISRDNVIAANPKVAGDALAALEGATQLAKRSAASKSITLSNLGSIESALTALAANQAILGANPDLSNMIAAQLDDANAIADASGFATAAGGPGTGAGGPPGTTGTGITAGSFSGPSGGGGGGGTGTVVTGDGTPASPAG
ncbi:hypothetical protein [Thiorhodococcus fuscus]|uniref:Uncharacterized protein n=1 Tax=Thiorhodococcus fuscus TaxID=527200 RepID=A0ABW4YBQ5_9GAMM